MVTEICLFSLSSVERNIIQGLNPQEEDCRGKVGRRGARWGRGERGKAPAKCAGIHANPLSEGRHDMGARQPGEDPRVWMESTE